MKIRKLGLVTMVWALPALTAAAQTTQISPTKPTPALATPTPKNATPPGMVTNSTLVDINSASAQDLDKLPGIGASRADAIIRNRPYKNKNDLLSRHIVPPNVYTGIKDKIVARQG